MVQKIVRKSGSIWIKGFYLGFMRDLKLLRIYRPKQVLKKAKTGFYTGSNIVTLGSFRHAERT